MSVEAFKFPVSTKILLLIPESMIDRAKRLDNWSQMVRYKQSTFPAIEAKNFITKLEEDDDEQEFARAIFSATNERTNKDCNWVAVVCIHKEDLYLHKKLFTPWDENEEIGKLIEIIATVLDADDDAPEANLVESARLVPIAETINAQNNDSGKATTEETKIIDICKVGKPK